MKHMSRTYKKEDAMLRPEHESTLEKNQAKRQKRKEFMGKEYFKKYYSDRKVKKVIDKCFIKVFKSFHNYIFYKMKVDLKTRSNLSINTNSI